MVPRNESVEWRALHLVAVPLCFSAVVLSLTRTVWFVGLAAFVLMLVAGVVIALRRTERPALGWPVAAGAGIALGIVVALAMPRVQWPTADPWELSYAQLEDRVSREVRSLRQGLGASPEGHSALTGRVGELGEWESAPTLIARQTANSEALALWRERPWLGWGTDAFRHVARPEPHAPAWIPNVVLHVLFDTGLVGLILLGSAVLLGVAGAVRVLARPVGSWGDSEFAVMGLLSALGALALCYQMTDGSWMGFTWFLFGLLVVSVRQVVRGT
jgi:O-antigen ligase